MKCLETEIEGLFVVDFKIFQDNRGRLIKPFSMPALANRGLNCDFKETWFTESKKDVIRAMHMQVGTPPCAKLVSVVRGGVTDVVLDTRKDSKTYGRYFEIELTSSNGLALYIPAGCAHGYKVLVDSTLTMYMATAVHSAEDDVGYRWDSFGYNWKLPTPILSDRDKVLPPFLKEN